VIGSCVRSALEAEYPELEILVLDDGSTDGTVAAAEEAVGGDPRAEVVRDGVNRGKAERLNLGLRRARHDLVLACDADTHMHPQAPKYLVARMLRSNLNAAVAGSPHVTNRTNLLCAMQVLEAASIIGLIRRSQALRGRVGTVAGVLALLHRERVLAVGGYRGQMATEDIDLTWRLLMAGWHTAFEPEALIGMQVPSRLSSLWAQRCRWARGQGEVLHDHLGRVVRWRQRGMWLNDSPCEGEAEDPQRSARAPRQPPTEAKARSRALSRSPLSAASRSRLRSRSTLAMTAGRCAHYCSARSTRCSSGRSPRLAAIRAELTALARGPREGRVVWEIPSERVDTTTG
jgi:Glycosyltransferase like family 2